MPDLYDEIVGEVLKDSREKLGLSQAEAGREIGVTGATMSNWENARSRLPVVTLMRYSLHVLGEHPSDVMRRIEQRLLGEADTY